MKNTIEKGKFRFLIYEQKNGFVGICWETGYVEEAKTAKETVKKLTSGTKAIILAVKDNPKLLPSINQKPPFKYRILFYLIPFWYSVNNIFSSFKELELFDKSTMELCSA